MAFMGVLVGASATPAGSQEREKLQVTAVSSRPGVVSGDDALIRVEVPASIAADKVRVEVDGRDVTSSFRPSGESALMGVVKELSKGDNRLTARAQGADAGQLTLKNHPITGPVFAGPHEQPFVCDTAEFKTVTGGTLGQPVDADCSVETRVDYMYRTTAGKFVPLPDEDVRPADLATATTSAGTKVPYIVRVETGTINRGIYETAVLHDPMSGTPDPLQRGPGWNGRLVYGFGGGCNGGWYVQGRNTVGIMNDTYLSKGYGVASSTLNVFGNNCNDLLAAETMSMVKERFVETYGDPAFTIGNGCSGGSYQTHQIADNYPGLLDGILSGCSFPDVGFGTIQTLSDAQLLNHYFKNVAPDAFTKEQQRAVSGFGKWESIGSLARAGGRIDPTVFCPPQLPEGQRYDPDTNPDGARCDVYSHTVNVYGEVPETGKARRPLDNTGIQYGLEALNKGTIDMDQFIDLNRRIGGLDDDAKPAAERTVADLKAVRTAYRTGRMLNGGPASPTFRSSTTATTRTTRRPATCTCASIPSPPGRAWTRPTAPTPTRSCSPVPTGTGSLSPGCCPTWISGSPASRETPATTPPSRRSSATSRRVSRTPAGLVASVRRRSRSPRSRASTTPSATPSTRCGHRRGWSPEPMWPTTS